MKIVCAKSELVKSINIVLKAVPGKTTMPILECILIDASASQIRFTANDMELGIETVVEGSVLERGMIALDAKLFSEIVRKLPENDVTIVSDMGLNTVISCENAVFRIMGMDGEGFTRLPVVDKDEPVVISSYTLKELIRQTLFSIAQNDTNRIMTGELFEIKENILRVISLDGHRVSIRKVALKDSYDPVKSIVPGKTLSELSKIISGETEDMVNMYFSANHLLLEFDRTIVVSRLIEGEYFHVDQMLSNDYETKITVNRRELQDCIDRALLLVREDDRKPLILNISGETLELKMNSQMGSMSEEMTVHMEGRDLKIGFNPKFLMDAMRIIDDERVDIYFINSKSPCFIRDSVQSYIYMILPVNFV